MIGTTPAGTKRLRKEAQIPGCMQQLADKRPRSLHSLKAFFNGQSSKEQDYAKMTLETSVLAARLEVLNEVDELLVTE